MKKFLIPIIAVLALSGAAFAQGMDDPVWSLRAGVQLGYAPNFFTQETDIDTFNTTSNQMEAGVFFDLPYARLSAAYGFLLSASGDPVEPITDYDRQYVDISVLGKLPLSLGSFTLWPALGVGYQIITFLNDVGDSGNDTDFYDAANDLYILGGVGMDFSLTDKLVITPSVLFGWDVMPVPFSGGAAEGESFRQFKVNANIGLAFNF